MSPSSRPVAVTLALGVVIGLSACGSDESADAEVVASTSTDESSDAAAPDVASPAEVAGEDDHDDEHGDGGHDDGEHDDGEHDDGEHDDGEHDDGEHDDGEHDDHDDDHDDDDHDHEEGEGEGAASGGLGAHEHGAAELTVAWIGDEVAVDLISPNFNVFGFEYEPVTDEDLEIEAERTAALTGRDLVTLDAGAECALAEPASTDVERDGSHSEITVSWRFVCAQPDEASELDLSGLFAEFPGFEAVDAQWVSDSDQSSAELTPSSTTLTLQR